MTRPTYETESDLTNEARAMQVICQHWGCSSVKLPRAHILDYALVRTNGMLFAMAEYKRRNKRYDTLMLSMHKVHAAERWARQGIPTYLFIEWPDGIYTHYLGSCYPIGWGGRTDRGDPADLEPVALIPSESFELIVGKQ